MVAKTRILDRLGAEALLLQQSLRAALLANDRVKYYLSLLQSAAQHATSPSVALPDLAAERTASGETDPSLDSVPARSEYRETGRLYIPGLSRIHRSILEAVALMLRPLEAAGADRGTALQFRTRLQELSKFAPGLDDDCAAPDFITALTSIDRSAGDSIHLLVMDLHKALNQLQASIAEENIRGAQVYGIEAGDRALIEAFQEGLNATAHLKFDHPGLGTTATRTNHCLLIQNDVGTTEAHVLILRVEGLNATVTSTDVHPARLRFFESLFEAYPVRWQSGATETAGENLAGVAFRTCTGRLEARTQGALVEYLRFLGSRIVFLIDWNRARKRLGLFVGKQDAIALLGWAAREEVGHRAFLELGGEELIYEAVRHSSGLTVQYGERLETLLGRDALMSYLKYVLRTTSQGLTEHRSPALIRDEIRAELLRQFHGVQETVMELAARQTDLIFDLACGVRDALLRAPAAASDRSMPRLAQRAAVLERKADDLVRRSNELARARHVPELLTALIARSDDIADHLEDAAFLVGFLPRIEQVSGVLASARELAQLLVDGAQELVKCVANAPLIRRGAANDDLHAFLEAANRLLSIEEETDSAQRKVTECLIGEVPGTRELFVFSELARYLEKAADQMARSAGMLREYALSETIGAG